VVQTTISPADAGGASAPTTETGGKPGRPKGSKNKKNDDGPGVIDKLLAHVATAGGPLSSLTVAQLQEIANVVEAA
jgi:hypothetical protein